MKTEYVVWVQFEDDPNKTYHQLLYDNDSCTFETPCGTYKSAQASTMTNVKSPSDQLDNTCPECFAYRIMKRLAE